jgi:hypothetical protein
MEKFKCKYCGATLDKVILPPENEWGVEYLMVCMNNECSYYVKGWEWMLEKYNVKASYRYKVNTFHGDDGPLSIRSPLDYTGWVVKKFMDKEGE